MAMDDIEAYYKNLAVWEASWYDSVVSIYRWPGYRGFDYSSGYRVTS
jgi:hypothetical protein